MALARDAIPAEAASNPTSSGYDGSGGTGKPEVAHEAARRHPQAAFFPLAMVCFSELQALALEDAPDFLKRY